MENTITSSGFTATELNTYKTTISTQLTTISSAISALETARQSLNNTILSTSNTLSTTIISGEQQIASTETKINSYYEAWQITKAESEKLKAPPSYQDTVLAQAEVKQARASLDAINNQIKKSIIEAPIEGQITKTSPHGTIEPPFHPGELVIGAQGKFFARSIDNNVKLTTKIFTESAKFKGTSIVEVLQNCVIYNDKAHGALTDKAHKKDRQLILEHGKPMIFGKERNRGIVLDGLKLKTVTIGENGITEKDILVHDAHSENPILHLMIAKMSQPEFPVAFGIIRAVKTDTYENKLMKQIELVKKSSSIKSMTDLLYSGNTWQV